MSAPVPAQPKSSEQKQQASLEALLQSRIPAVQRYGMQQQGALDTQVARADAAKEHQLTREAVATQANLTRDAHGDEAKMQREARTADLSMQHAAMGEQRRLDREQRTADLQMQLEQGALTRDQANDARRDIAKMQDDTRREMAEQQRLMQKTIASGQQQTSRDVANIKANPAGKPLTSVALKMQQEALDLIGTTKSINADLGAVDKQISDGTLQLGPMKNITGSVQNTLGLSTESSRNLQTFKATLEKLRNDSLRLNKGVQTEGDAQRAWNELVSNINDPKVVQQRLAEIQALNDRAAALQKMNIDVIRSNYGYEPLDTSKYEAQPPAIGARPGDAAKITGDADFNALPSGALFIGPDGKTRRKP